MKTVYKKAISLANKNGQNFIKEMAAYYTYIGIEEGNISNWFVLIAKSKETGKTFIEAEVDVVAITNDGKLYRRMPEILADIFKKELELCPASV